MQSSRTEFAQALRAIATERGLNSDVILDTIKQAIIAAYKKDAKEMGEDVEAFEYEVNINPSTGEAQVFSFPPEKPEEKKDITPPGFGRIAAQTAKQVIHQKIREAEKGAIMDEYVGRIGSLISGLILRFEGPDVRVDLGRTEGILPSLERVPGERLNLSQRLTFLLKEIIDTQRGKQIILSRADADFVKKLFEREVPEVSSNSVEIKAIAREAGVRTKMAVFSNQSGVDPVGSCVGQKGVRVQAVTNELGGERVDIIPWSENSSDLIKASLSPAENLVVVLDEAKKTAIVKAPEDQLSSAIGRDGQNARLAAKLTNYKIEIKEIKGEKIKGDKGKEKEEPQTKDEKNATTVVDVISKDAVSPETTAVDSPANNQKTNDSSSSITPVVQTDIADSKIVEKPDEQPQKEEFVETPNQEPPADAQPLNEVVNSENNTVEDQKDTEGVK